MACLRCKLIFALLVLSSPRAGLEQQTARGQETAELVSWQVPHEHNRWARFQLGAWKIERSVTEALAESGAISHTSIATTTTTLADVAEKDYQLTTHRTVDVDGKRLSAEPQTTRYDLFDQSGAPATTVRSAATATVHVDGTPVACQVYRLETASDQGKELTTIYYAEDFSPYVLRRETRLTDANGKNNLSERTEEVVHLRLRRKVLGTLLWTSQVKTVQRNSKGSTVTVAYRCERIPGEVVEQMSTEFDSAGKAIRCSTLELIGYGCESRSVHAVPQYQPRPRRLRRAR
ncbi:MAG: hypothetical protein A2W31_08765 [Planctomycetes bacterium RBG_16_64_10]|nr:MAG: hypothetical protein A2W31_08765 [Planctomycetes bacterium RBG_16_64_10]